MNHNIIDKNYDDDRIVTETLNNKNIRIANSWKDLLDKLLKFMTEIKNYPEQLNLANDAYQIYINMFTDSLNFEKCKKDADYAFKKLTLINKIRLELKLNQLYLKLGLYNYVSNLYKSYVDYQHSAKLFGLELNLIGF